MTKPTSEGRWLESCPLCAEHPYMMPWHGGGPKKRLIGCLNERCPVQPSACESTATRAADAWNYRVRATEASRAFVYTRSPDEAREAEIKRTEAYQ